MTFGILPVKAPVNAKQRLAGVLSPAGREQLARALFAHVLGVMLRVRGFDAVAVATSDGQAADAARKAGALVFEETEQHSHSRSADAAARRAMALGARTIALLPIDVPLVDPAEVESLIAPPLPGLVIVPSADGTGTNALVRTPPDAIESRFGPGSFKAHIEQTTRKGITIRVMHPVGIVFDVDTPDDLAEWFRLSPDTARPFFSLARWKSA